MKLEILLVDLVDDELIEGWNVSVHTVILTIMRIRKRT